MDQAYLDVKPNTEALAVSFSKTTSIPSDDFIGIANELFEQAYKAWSGKSSFKTFFHTTCRRAFNRSAIRHPAPMDSESKPEEVCRELNPREVMMETEDLESRLDGLSSEAKTVATMAMYIFDEVPSALPTDSGRALKSKLRDCLREEWGWSRSAVSEAFQEIKTFMGGEDEDG